MNDPLDWLFFLNIAWIATHELDAIQQHEWRIFPLTAFLDDLWGYRVFVVLHIPLFALIIGYAHNPDFQAGFNLFLIFHAVIHGLFEWRDVPGYEFRNTLSRGLIFGAAPLGLLHLLLNL